MALPLLLAHLALAAEQLLVRLAVAASDTVPQRGVLAVVEIKVEMMHRVACSTIKDGAVGDILAIVDQDGPDLHEDEEAQVSELLEREQKWKQVIWCTLEEAVDGVEGHGGVRGWHDPLVVRLMQGLVNRGVVQAAVDEVDEAVGEDEEERELEHVVPHAGSVVERVVQLGVALHLQPEARRREQGDIRHAGDGLLDLHLDLVLEELGMLEGCLVEDEDVREGRHNEVNGRSAEPVAVLRDGGEDRVNKGYSSRTR